MSKSQKLAKVGLICPVCESSITYMRVINTEKSDKTEAWRFNQNHVAVCKCNEKEVFA